MKGGSYLGGACATVQAWSSRFQRPTISSQNGRQLSEPSLATLDKIVGHCASKPHHAHSRSRGIFGSTFS